MIYSNDLTVKLEKNIIYLVMLSNFHKQYVTISMR